MVNQILPIVQYYAYAQINEEAARSWRALPITTDPWNMWLMFHELSLQHPNLGTGMIQGSAHVYNIFKKLFQKRPS